MIIPIPFTYSVGGVIYASQQNSNIATIYNDYNGNITTANLSATAAIADTQLSQISTASKISGAALTLLTSTPAGAGVFPIANLPSLLATANILNYGTSATTGSAAAPATLKIAYGIQVVASGSPVSITNLLFTSASTYTTVISNANNSGTAVTLTIDSGSQITLYAASSTQTISWLAIGI